MNLFFQRESTIDCEAMLIDTIYEAALYPHLWPQVLNGIRELCHADQCTLFYYDRTEHTHNYAAAARARLPTLDLFLKEFIAAQAAHINNQLRGLHVGQVVTDDDIFQLSGKSYAQMVGNKYMQCLWPKLNF